MDEEVVETDVSTVGERLRAAREEQGMRLEDIAAQTRIPLRHLESLETGSWEQLPAQTYTTGFAKSYASAVGLDRVEIGEQLRAEMGGERSAAATTTEVFEAADPARTMPTWLVLGAIAAVIVLVLAMTLLNRRELATDDGTVATAPPAAQAPAAAVSPPPAATASGPVVLTAAEPVWLQVYEKGGKQLFSGELAAGQVYAVPADAKAPMLKTGKPEALRISVGSAAAPAVGPAAATVRDVSLLGPDLMRGGAQSAAPAQ
ncbi:MAG: RodZ domain-containing protein [Sphingomicrobium sp.]